jgi:hypothetical protein
MDWGGPAWTRCELEIIFTTQTELLTTELAADSPVVVASAVECCVRLGDKL